MVRLRDEVRQRPDDYLALYSLAAALHQLDFKHPDGGRRVPEAERLYRRAAHLAPQRQQKAIIFSNLGALLLSSGRLQRALEVGAGAGARWGGREGRAAARPMVDGGGHLKCASTWTFRR